MLFLSGVKHRQLRFIGDDSTKAGPFESQTFLFHASGRQRFELRPEPCLGTPVSAALALIGESHGVAAALEALQSAAVVATATTAVQELEWEASARRVAAHPLFRVLGYPLRAAGATGLEVDEEHEQAAGKVARAQGWLLFRLSVQGSGKSDVQHGEGVDNKQPMVVTDREAGAAPYHVNLNQVNEKLLNVLNGSAGPAFLSSVTLKQPQYLSGGSQVWLRWAVGGRLGMVGVWWEELCAGADALVSRHAGMRELCGAGLVTGGQACPKGEARLHMLDNRSSESDCLK